MSIKENNFMLTELMNYSNADEVTRISEHRHTEEAYNLQGETVRRVGDLTGCYIITRYAGETTPEETEKVFMHLHATDKQGEYKPEFQVYRLGKWEQIDYRYEFFASDWLSDDDIKALSLSVSNEEHEEKERHLREAEEAEEEREAQEAEEQVQWIIEQIEQEARETERELQTEEQAKADASEDLEGFPITDEDLADYEGR